MKKVMLVCAMLLVILVVQVNVYAVELNVHSNGWSMTVDNERLIRGSEGTPSEGLINWKDPAGYDYVFQDSWWGRDSTASAEGPFSSLELLSSSQPATNKIILNLKDNESLYIDMSYELIGSGLTSSIFEKATLTNTGTHARTLSFFKYADFDLCYGYNAHDNDSAFGNTASIIQSDSWSTATIIPTSLAPSAFQIAQASGSGSIISSLNDGSATNLINTGSPFGPGDASFAFQWILTLEPNQVYTLENTKTLTTTPEPASIFLFSIGGIGLLRKAFRKKGVR